MYTVYTACAARILPREQGAAATCTAREAAAQALVAGAYSSSTCTADAHVQYVLTQHSTA
jgi:hypothetical protein